MRLRMALGSAVLAATASLLPTAPALAVDTPPETGCPASNEVLVVADLIALGYRVPAQVDAAGNNNGLVCGKPFSAGRQEQFCKQFVGGCPVPIIYQFRDDDITG